ncbi:MAG TPA: hypothetical protein VFY64_01090 [Nitrososphaeraceae archaeon]|nr:hypothetical protein [Nitrososphaeraceae archaeon]
MKTDDSRGNKAVASIFLLLSIKFCAVDGAKDPKETAEQQMINARKLLRYR